MADKQIKTLLVSTLFPSSERPVHGIFVETRLRELLKSGAVQTEVIAPVPWFPFSNNIFGEYAQFARTPRQETRNGIKVHHPRYFLPPKVGMNIAPHTLARAILPVAKSLLTSGFDFDLIDAHYYYPDGVAASIVANALGKPFVVTARGTDLNLIPEHAYPRRLILKTAHKAHASIGVCKALMDRLAELGADPGKLHVFRNGVDLQRFTPEPTTEARQRLGISEKNRILLSVGHLIERKGHHIAIQALANMPEDHHLYIVGSGQEEARLRMLSNQLGINERVHFKGAVPNTNLKWWYSAADAVLLCSSREGWANVLLESMACGTPVIATNIWGTPEVVSSDDAGRLMSERTPQSLADTLSALLANYPDRSRVRKHAEKFSWNATTENQLALFREICHA